MTAQETGPGAPERWQDELREWCSARAVECGSKAQDPAIAERLQLGWSMCADAFACVIEKIDDMDPINATPPSTCIETINGDPDTALRLSFQVKVF